MNLTSFNHSTSGRLLSWPLGLSGGLGLALGAALCTTSLPTQGQVRDVSNDYTVQTVQPPDDTVFIGALFINDRGTAVIQDWAQTTIDCGDGAILENGQWKRFRAPMPDGTPSTHTSPCNPDSSGRVAVCYNGVPETLGQCICRKALYHNGAYSPFAVQGYPTWKGWNWCLSYMNDHGLITGYAWVKDDPSIPNHGVLLNESLSVFQLVDPPDSQWTNLQGINNAQTMVGQYLNGQDGLWHGFVTDQGKSFTDFDIPGVESGTMPNCINNNGEICGSWLSSGWNGGWQADGTMGFILRKGVFSTFSVPGSSWTILDWMTDSGKLAGFYSDASGNVACFIATPKAGRK